MINLFITMYNNEYNHRISKKINQINKYLLNHENKLTHTDSDDHKITSRLEGMVLRDKNIRGVVAIVPQRLVITAILKIQL